MTNPTTVITPEQLEAVRVRFWARVFRGEVCWEWQGGRDSNGYGQLWFNNKRAGAHRVAYLLERGPIPPGLVIDHLCHNRKCVRPDHLQLSTVAANSSRKITAGQPRKTHCVNGHQFTDENTKIRPKGRRKCRACDRDQAMKRYHAKKGIDL